MFDLLTTWIEGELSSRARVWSALAPAVLLAAWFILGLGVYVVRYAIKGAYRDSEMEARSNSVFAGVFVRQYFVWLMRPVWAIVLRLGIPANAITTLSLLLAVGAGIALSDGRFALGGWLYIFSGVLDALDGRVARLQGTAGPRGQALDSILDRYSDSAILIGLAWFYRDTWVLLPALIALVGTSIIPYIKARGESLGIEVRVGVAQRAERIIYLGAPCALSPILEVIINPDDPRPLHRMAVVGIVLLAVATQLTALQRFVFLMAALRENTVPRLAVRAKTMARNIVAALMATGADFLLVLTLVTGAAFSPPLATGIGCALGGVINFGINRVWTFGSTAPKLPQAGRYAFVSFTSALLNAGGVAVMLYLPAFDFRVAWVLVRAAVFLTWNFPLHRDYVFARTVDGTGESGAPAEG